MQITSIGTVWRCEGMVGEDNPEETVYLVEIREYLPGWKDKDGVHAGQAIEMALESPEPLEAGRVYKVTA